MPHIDLDTAALLVRRWDGTASATDDAALAEWLAEDAARDEIAQRLHEVWLETGRVSYADSTQSAAFRQRVRSAIHEMPRQGIHRQAAREGRTTHRNRLKHIGAWSVIAAGAFAAATLFVLRGTSSDSAPPAAHYATQAGERATVDLPNGNRATLAPQTTLQVEGTKITLDGEAIFEVRHRADAPLVVNVRSAQVRVLGTTFSVRGYADDVAVRVAVQDGKVALASTNAIAGPVVLSEGWLGVMSDSGTVDTAAHAPQYVGAALAWRQDALVFDRTALREVVKQLSRWYGVAFTIRDSSVARIPLTMTFKSSDSIDAIMHAISVTTGMTVRRDGSTVVITAAPRAVVTPTLTSPPTVARGGGR